MRDSDSRRLTSAISRRRPTKVVISAGSQAVGLRLKVLDVVTVIEASYPALTSEFWLNPTIQRLTADPRATERRQEG
ncbi:hypothetical protein GCM10010151_13880 [Actinoallomurus spadix]|uniref:Uncharacterized protein n=1 Tax=Actinoallomurus spadix TaxID=79912 RepID=A0ABN0W4W3_9ACTN